MSILSSIGNAISGAYNTVKSTIGNLLTSKPVNLTANVSSATPSYTPVPGGSAYKSQPTSTPVPIGGGYAPTSIKSGISPTLDAFNQAMVKGLNTPTAINSFMQNYNGTSYSANYSAYSAPGGSTNSVSSFVAPTNTSVNAGTINSTSAIIPSAPASTNYHGAVVGNNIGVGANPATGVIDKQGQTAVDVNGNPTVSTETAANTSAKAALDEYLKNVAPPASQADSYNRAKSESGLDAAQIQKNNTQNAINSITAKMNTDLLQLRGTASREGVTEAVYGGQQAEITREATITLLPLQAQLAADQGNLELAQQHTDSLFKIYSTDAQNAVDYKNAQLKAVYDFATTAQKRQLDLIDKANSFAGDVLKTQITNQQTIANELLKAGNTAGYKAVTAIRPPTNTNSPTYAKDKAIYDAQISQAVTQYGASIGALDRQEQKARIDKLNAEAALKGGVSNVSDYVQTNAGGKAYVNYDNLTNDEKKTVALSARKVGIPLLKTADVAKLNAIDDSKENLINIESTLSSILPKDAYNRVLGNNNMLHNKLSSFFQTNPDISSFNAWRTAIINNVQALAGGAGSGLRINQAEINAAMNNDLPKITDTIGTANGKITKLRSQLNSWEGILTKGSFNDTQAQTVSQPPQMKLPNGTVLNLQADGTYQ